jgi:predicted phage-related endonuclease
MQASETRANWLKERQSIVGVGASESAALFSLHPYLSAFSLFEKLVNPRPPTEEEAEEEIDVQSFGLAIEPYLADWYARKTGRNVAAETPGIARLMNKPYIFASPDRTYNTRHANVVEDGQCGVLELKSAVYFKEEEPLPDYWQVQAQQQMLCTGLPMASFAILGGFRRRYLVNDIPANPAFHAILIERIGLFMLAVQEGSWGRFDSPVDGSKATTEALKRLYPKETGTAVRLPAEASSRMVEIPGTNTMELRIGWADRRDQVKAQIKELEAEEARLSNQLRLAIGENTYGILEDGTGFSLKTTKGSTYTVTKADYRQLRRVQKMPRGGLLE